MQFDWALYRSPLMETLGWRVKTLSRKCNLTGLFMRTSFLMKNELDESIVLISFRLKLRNFWSDETRLPNSTLERLVQVLRAMYSPNTESQVYTRNQLILSLFSLYKSRADGLMCIVLSRNHTHVRI